MKKRLVVGLVVLVVLLGVGFIGCFGGSAINTHSEIVKWDIPQVIECQLPPYFNPWTKTGFVPIDSSSKSLSVPDGLSFVSKNPYIALISPLSAYHVAISRGADSTWAIATYLGGGSIVVGQAYLQRWSPIQDDSFGGYKR